MACNVACLQRGRYRYGPRLLLINFFFVTCGLHYNRLAGYGRVVLVTFACTYGCGGSGFTSSLFLCGRHEYGSGSMMGDLLIVP